MSWFVRLKLNMLPVLDSDKIDGIILSRDIYARLGLPREWSDRLSNRTAAKVFNSAASAEGYADEHTFRGKPLNFGILDAWKKLGHCLVHLSCGPTHPPGFPPVPLECIVRTAESAWELYSLSETEESNVDLTN